MNNSGGFLHKLTVTCMWSGGISKRNPVKPAGKWARGMTCQTAKTPTCHIQFVVRCAFIVFIHIIQ